MIPNIVHFKFLIILLILSAFHILLPAPASAALMDRVVAEVNGEIITLSELEEEMATLDEDFLRDVPPGERERTSNGTRRQILSGMIDRLLVEQQANRRGIYVGDREVDAALDQIREENGLSEEEFVRELERVGTSMAGYRQHLRSQILQSRLLNVEIRERIVIPETRIRRYYEDNYVDDGEQEQGYHILQIGFTWPDDADDQARAEARSRAVEARDQVVAGADFRKLARELSELPSASEGGDLGVFQKEEMAAEMQRHIPELEPGELTPVIEMARSYQFFKLHPGGDLLYEDAREEIREKLYNQALEERFEKWVESLREDAYIRIML